MSEITSNAPADYQSALEHADDVTYRTDERDTDTTPADNQQLFALIAALEQAQQTAAEQGITVYDLQHRGRDEAEQGDPQWAGPSLPHPTEAGSPEEADELRQDWGDYDRSIEPTQEQIEA